MKKIIVVFAVILAACNEEDEPKKDCTPLKSTMELAAIALFSVERQNPYNYGNEPTKQEVDEYQKQYDKYFFEYTLATKNYHDCKY